MKDKIKARKAIIIVISSALLIASSILISLEKFNTRNPIATGSGLIKIMFTQTEIVQIQDYPAVFLAKPDHAQQSLIEFMEQEGYHHVEDERLSSTLVFKNDATKRYVDFSVNGYYSKWVFKGHL
ncbi:hypothetical protein RH915_10965 [Serpentinicella sp. ANB-PHB4]|uniref:hypothetical protein n=1 Tax=Serpentinicella sp. ANB-PHB4 TaxID=3074076 RepID=UPI00285D95DE|nr:hypothetical protein [Serpentinicella sp. ANB-PHB4]MDR5660010.1 hypothetical protein [Serpentinicella sp. ANB-PHB4]